MKYTAIKYAVHEHILTLTLNRPDKMNAINEALGMELISALKAANEDDDIRAMCTYHKWRL